MSNVRHFHSGMPGAPALTNGTGSLHDVLEACLVTGFSLVAVERIEVQGGIATCTVSTGNPFRLNAVVQISGTGDAALDTTHVVTGGGQSTFTVRGVDRADGVLFGLAMSAKLAPAGWRVVSSSNGNRTYGGAGTGYLHVQDLNVASYAIVQGCLPFPDGASPTNIFAAVKHWPKSTSSTACYWFIAADDKTIWFYVSALGSATQSGASGWLSGFGDIQSRKAGDVYCAVLYAPSDTAVATKTSLSAGVLYAYTPSSLGSNIGYIARSYTGLGYGQPVANACESFESGIYSGVGSLPYPNGPDGALLLSRTAVYESDKTLRGTARGLYLSPQKLGEFTFSTGDTLDASLPDGRRLFALKGAAASATSSGGVTGFVDITGPWS